MEREALLTLLLMLFGGLAMQPLAAMSFEQMRGGASLARERQAWLRLWLPLVPVMLIAAWLGGWALREPDPVHARVGVGALIAACAPFILIVARALVRATVALAREPNGPICTVGFWRPQIVFSPFFARSMEDRLVRAAWEHELAHVRHRDPLRIWLAQIATDLQWPWPSAGKRFQAWLEALEWARDDEARARGVCGADLASAVVVVARCAPAITHCTRGKPAEPWGAPLLGAHAHALHRRVSRLLAPLPGTATQACQAWQSSTAALVALASVALVACVLGAADGSMVLSPFLAWTWAV